MVEKTQFIKVFYSSFSMYQFIKHLISFSLSFKMGPHAKYISMGINQGKRAFKVIENIENCDGFKKGDYIVVDAMHKDHLEVFDRHANWKSVANFDGTKNKKKTEQGAQEPRQKLKQG